MKKYYKLSIAGLERNLPIFPINDKLSIAAFIMFGDVEITIASAKDLIAKSPEFDCIVTPEAKSIPLAYEMSRQSGKPYLVVRKSAKLYMDNPKSVNTQSITTKNIQTLYLDSTEGETLRGKRVLIVDDVISTGESLLAVTKLLSLFDANIIGKAAVLAEGDAANRSDIFYLEKLPLLLNE